ncbi:MAG: hemerythrin domain-containing protein [Rubrivivax sp.]|nr:hemerythrin domain-containing protein [Rubrivivax sp.]
MSIAAPGTAAVGFDTPLAMLGECHRRVERQCATLERLVPHLAAHGSDAAAREAAEAVLRYFDQAAPNHHADEEQDLFPALLESMAGSDAVCLREIITSLRADHRELDHRWAALRRTLQAVAAAQPATLEAADVQAFAALYARHIEREEGELLPMADRLLGAGELERIGHAMQRRRGLA